MALSANEVRDYEQENPLSNHLPVQAAATIFAGAATTLDASGDVGIPATGEEFAGFAETLTDNSSGAAGAVRARLRSRGAVALEVTGVTGDSDVGDDIYVVQGTDDSFTLTAGTNVAVGTVRRYVSGTKVIVYFEASHLRSI